MEKKLDAGLLVFTYPPNAQPTTMEDHIAVGFMTFEENGVLMRVKSRYLGDFIELRLVRILNSSTCPYDKIL